MRETKKIQVVNPFTVLLKNFHGDKDIQVAYNLFIAYPLVILKSNCQVSIKNLKKIVKVFGDIYSYSNKQSPKQINQYHADQTCEIIRVSNTTDKNGKSNGVLGNEFINWHSDFSHIHTDFHGSMLYNKKNGHKSVTSFLSTFDLLALLSKKEYEQLKMSNGYHSLNSRFYKMASPSVQRQLIKFKKGKTGQLKELTSKPMIITTIRQQEVLYLSPATLQFIDNDLKVSKYIKLIDELYHYHHHWEPHDIVIYDNLSLHHKRQPFSGERVLYRINFNYKKIPSIIYNKKKKSGGSLKNKYDNNKKLLSFHFNDILNKSIDLCNLVIKNGVILIKGVPGLKEAHTFINPFAVYKNTSHLTWAHSKSFPATVEVSNIVNLKTGRMGWFQDRELGWHTNGVCMNDPEHCVGLLCSISAKRGGETEIIHLRKVYNDLDDKFIQSLKNLRISYKKRNAKKFYQFDDFESSEFGKHSCRQTKTECNLSDEFIKDLIYKHPIDKEYGLYFPFTLLESIVGFSQEQSKRLSDELKNLCLLKKYRISVKLEKNDFLLMDQFHTIHRRKEFQGMRKLFRIAFYWKKP